MRTYSLRPKEVSRSWYLLDASDTSLGRTATTIASLLLGKHKPAQSPHIDNGDFVIVINSDRLKITGEKMLNKLYRRHSGHPGSLRQKNLKDLLTKDSTLIVRSAVRGMLPDNKLRQSRLARLKIYPNSEHPHSGQNPQPLKPAEKDKR